MEDPYGGPLARWWHWGGRRAASRAASWPPAAVQWRCWRNRIESLVDGSEAFPTPTQLDLPLFRNFHMESGRHDSPEAACQQVSIFVCISHSKICYPSSPYSPHASALIHLKKKFRYTAVYPAGYMLVKLRSPDSSSNAFRLRLVVCSVAPL
eukprot:scaffold1344_cov221-Pinguiococcus_pyrenoidosus.AAC.2